ncbi:MAG: hypothetical protein H6Q68_639 [Firmicutes bacterium]|nr:hypothetical protein [Bacillota bacterium]
MSDKQLENLLNGFVRSSQSLNSLQEGILSLHGVMEQFHKATEDFAVKNEIDTLLPRVNEHFVQANEMYSNITNNLKKIQVHTEEMQVTGQLCCGNIELSWQQLNNIQAYLQKYLDEIIPFYQIVDEKMAIVHDVQQSTEIDLKIIHTDMNKILNMHSELTRKLEQHKELLHQTAEQQQDVVKVFTTIGEIGDKCATQSAQTFAELKAIGTYLEQYTQEMVPAYQNLQAEVGYLKDMQSNMTEVARSITGSVQEMGVMQQELQLQLTEYRQMMTESRRMQGELLAIAQKNLAMNAFVEKMKGTEIVATEYFNGICEQWQKEHLNDAVEKWAEENLDVLIMKKIKGAFGLYRK